LDIDSKTGEAMHISKWMRKNSKKIMVFVVIFSMVSFVIGYTGIQIFFSIFGGGNPVIGTYDGGGQKVRAREFMAAQGELKLLRMLGADRLLMAQGQQGLAGPLTAHLLFPDSQFVGDLAAQLKQVAQSGRIPVSVDKIEEFFGERTQAEITWILLKAEAHKAGFHVSDEMARTLLGQFLPQLAQDADANQMINAIMASANVSEDQLVRIFAELLGVMSYASNVTDSQAVTLNQVQAAIGRSKETFDAEFVQIPAEWYIDNITPVAQEDLARQFETFKNILPGTFSDDNPYGFGYKLPKRIRLEYMAVLLDDVKTQTEKPTAENMEDYYSRNIERFRYEEPVDPNKPDGEKVTKTRSFAEAMPQIRNGIEQERINRLANQIFNDAKTITEKGFAAVNVEEAAIDQLQAAAGDYMQTATDLSGRYKIPVLSGQTGWLSTADFGNDSILRELRLQQGAGAVQLAEVVYAVELNAKDTPRRIGTPVVRPWENIGPMIGGHSDEAARQYHRLMTMVRIVGIEEETTPAAMDVSYSTKGMVILPSQQQEEGQTTFILGKQVADDVRRVKAMEIAAARAQSLAAMVKERGWDEAITAFNAEYAPKEGDPKVNLETARQQMRLSAADMEMARRHMAANPISASYVQTRLKTNILNDLLYDLLPDGESATGTIFEVVEVKAKEACYVVKAVTLTPATEADYLENKVMTALQLNTGEMMELALVHFKTKNLFDRMGYKAEAASIIERPAPIDLPAPGEGF
jgi:hypothetical protein